MNDQPPEYAVAHVREALATDPRVNELNLEVTIHGEKVFVTGVVATVQRRAAVTLVIEELLPGMDVHNETDVAQVAGTPEVESI